MSTAVTDLADMNLSGKKVVVFGGSGNIGSAVCKLLDEHGAEVCFTYFENAQQARSVAETMHKCHMLRCDVRHSQQVLDSIDYAGQQMGRIDAVVYCVGLSGDATLYTAIGKRKHGTILDTTQKELLELMQINAEGAYHACQAAVHAMQDRGGNIVLIGSMVAAKAVASPVHFTMSKAALKGLVESLAKDAGAYGICVNLLAPGLLTAGASRVVSQELKDTYLKHCSLKRFAEAREIAEFTVWMALQNSYVTGQCILLDGGL